MEWPEGVNVIWLFLASALQSVGLNTAGHFIIDTLVARWCDLLFKRWSFELLLSHCGLDPVCPFRPLTPDINKAFRPHHTTTAHWIIFHFGNPIGKPGVGMWLFI